MSTRTDALLSQQETGKITASIIPVMSGCHPALVLPTISELRSSATQRQKRMLPRRQETSRECTSITLHTRAKPTPLTNDLCLSDWLVVVRITGRIAEIGWHLWPLALLLRLDTGPHDEPARITSLKFRTRAPTECAYFAGVRDLTATSRARGAC